MPWQSISRLIALNPLFPMQIAITGIGLIHATEVAPRCVLSTSHTEWPIGEVPFTNDELKARLGMETSSIVSRNILLGMVALRDALLTAGLSEDDIHATPLISGTTVGGMDITESRFSDWQNGNLEQIGLLRQHEADYTSAFLREHFGLATHLTISTACSSALNAMIHGANLLRLRKAQRVVVGGTEAMTRFHLNGFASLGILSRRICRPFQDDRDGINLGEASAYLVLEDAGEASRRGATIYGYLAGYANRCDAYHQTASSPEGDGAYDAMSDALMMSGLHAEQIAYISAHGTATPNNDASEMHAIRRLFGERLPLVESTKPTTGHTTSASGSLEAIFTLRRLKEMGARYALCNAFGFGGNDSSIVLSLEPVSLPDVTDVSAIRRSSLHQSDGDWDYKPFIPAMQARRMTPMMRQLIVAARKALNEAGIVCPDGIVVGTRWGGMVPSAQLLRQLSAEGEQNLSPALFMNSTHNAAAGTLARMLGCKGYNMTIVSSSNTLSAAEQDASMPLLLGEMRSVLVCTFDEADEEWASLVKQAGLQSVNNVQAEVIWCD